MKGEILMKNVSRLMVASLALFALAGCSSSDAGGVDDASTAADSRNDTSSSPDMGAMDMGTADTRELPASDAASDVGGKDAGPADTGAMSADCKTYCDCFEANCASIQAIPGGLSCGDFCAGFTKDQWTCRNAHCQLVVPEKNPGHCQHAVGIDQCM